MEHNKVRGEKSILNWLIDYLRFYVPLKNISLIWRRHHYQWRAAKFRPMLGAQGLWAGRDLYRATPAVTRGLGFFGLIRRTAPFSRLLRYTRGCGGSILTRFCQNTHAVKSIYYLYNLVTWPCPASECSIIYQYRYRSLCRVLIHGPRCQRSSDLHTAYI